MQILVLYTLYQDKHRKTITEHLYSFRKYAKEHEFVYVNIGPDGLPPYLKDIPFDAVILHYTFLAGERFLEGNSWDKKIKGISGLQGFKIAIPQDEYCYTGRLVELFKNISVDVVCTCFYKSADIDFAYGQYLSKKVKYIPVFTGYVDEKIVKEIAPLIKPCSERPIDIGYRASMLPAHLGKHGQLKYELIGEFNDRLKKSDLVLDIRSSNNTLTTEDKSAVKLGNQWNIFLLNCKAFIGCEGGSSLLDFDGSIQGKVYAYADKTPNASFEEIAKACFPMMDNNISCFAISPRHFEAAITKTLQILVEGYYGGIFKAGQHYLSLKKDFSNFSEVIETLHDNEKCQQIIDQAYVDIVTSGKYSYGTFVSEVLNTIQVSPSVKKGKKSLRASRLINRLYLRELYIKLYVKFYVGSNLQYYSKMNPYWLAYDQYVKYLRPYIKSKKK